MVVLDDFAEVEKRGVVGDAGGLLHVVGDEDDGVVLLELVDEFLDARGGDGIEGGAGLVHEEDGGLDREGPGDAEALLLAAGEAQGILVEAVLDLVPEGGIAERLLDDLVECLLVADALEAEAVGDVVVNGLGEGVGFLEDHADVAAQGDDVDLRAVDVDAPDADLAAEDAGAVDRVVEPVEGAQEGGLATAGGADEGGNVAFLDVYGDRVENELLAVGEAEALHFDAVLPGSEARGGRRGVVASCCRVDRHERRLVMCSEEEEDGSICVLANFNSQEDAGEGERPDEEEEDEGGTVLHVPGVVVLRELLADDIEVVGECHDALEEEIAPVAKVFPGILVAEGKGCSEEDGRGFAGHARGAHDGGCEDAGEGAGEDVGADGGPLGGTEGERAFSVALGDGAEGGLAGYDDDGEDHEGEGPPAGEDGDAPAEEVDEKAESEEAEDDGGHAGELEDGEPDEEEGAALAAVFAEEDGAEDTEEESDGAGTGDENGGAGDGGADAAGAVGVSFVVEVLGGGLVPGRAEFSIAEGEGGGA